MSNGARIALSGKRVICCIHDRVKREVTTEAQVWALGQITGRVYDPTQHKIHLCACCENLFVDPTDIPRYCSRCQLPNIHPAGGSLAAPRGVVDG